MCQEMNVSKDGLIKQKIGVDEKKGSRDELKNEIN